MKIEVDDGLYLDDSMIKRLEVEVEKPRVRLGTAHAKVVADMLHLQKSLDQSVISITNELKEILSYGLDLPITDAWIIEHKNDVLKFPWELFTYRVTMYTTNIKRVKRFVFETDAVKFLKNIDVELKNNDILFNPNPKIVN